jgi:hypothetical protein
MRLTRRQILGGGLGLCGCSFLRRNAFSESFAADERGPFVCLTEQVPLDGGAEIQELLEYLGNSDEPITIIPYTNPGESATFVPFQLMLKEDAWKPSDSLEGEQEGRIKIAVHFQDGTEAQKQLVRSVAAEWSERDAAPVDFVFDSPIKSHIRVRFTPRFRVEAGQWSYVGRRAKRYGPDEPTLMLERCDRATILHEFGHAIGLRHEQSHPENGIDWNKAALYEYYKVKYKWNKKKVDQQVLKVYSKSYICKGSSKFDKDSVMIYAIPGYLLNSGNGTKLNQALSSGDIACVRRMYSEV